MINEQKKISETVIRRMPIYYRYINDLIEKRIDRISSSELSKMTGFTASQIRQDLNNFGGFGQQGYGYNTKELLLEITKILGIEKTYNTIIVGAGHLGMALARYKGFRNSGFFVKAMFDLKEKKDIDSIEIKSIDELEEYIEKENIEVGIITVPKSEAIKVANRLVKSGIKGIWNFAPIDISPIDDVVIENIRLNDSLLTLSYYMKESKK